MIRTILSISLFFCSTLLFQTGTAFAAQAKGCTRATLQAAVDSYIAAQKAGDPSKMSLASSVKYVQNWMEIYKEEGLWNSPLPVAFHRSILDVDACRTFTTVIVTEGNQYVIGTRLKLEDGRIAEIESMYTTKRDWLFNADNYLKYSLALVNGKIRYIHTLTLTVPGIDPVVIMGRQPEQKPKSNPPAKAK